jgi:hypothetical protein
MATPSSTERAASMPKSAWFVISVRFPVTLARLGGRVIGPVGAPDVADTTVGAVVGVTGDMEGGGVVLVPVSVPVSVLLDGVTGGEGLGALPPLPPFPKTNIPTNAPAMTAIQTKAQVRLITSLVTVLRWRFSASENATESTTLPDRDG